MVTTGVTHQASTRWGARVRTEVGGACGATADIQTSMKEREELADGSAKVSGAGPGGVKE